MPTQTSPMASSPVSVSGSHVLATESPLLEQTKQPPQTTATPSSKTVKTPSPGSRRGKHQSESNGQVDSKQTKPNKPSSAHETRLSLSSAYAQNAQAKVNYLKEKINEEKRQWTAKQEAEKMQRATEIQLREREHEERRAARKHELVLELLRQEKSMEAIEALVNYTRHVLKSSTSVPRAFDLR
ncbi:hypothetical protein PHYPSEUDO_003583 [Phytophthora pseudosyringae]|uniref:Uncharacterized protein n=1 Tax=Phytophthora pseudosyringae TaxID=221518 RepID=A0A8T1VRH9_9STRA|nr:hypothetical protein PHYPSEUDO_003583 [Phytophthora pseudosyringae]